MRFVFFTHSIVADWNHGNAHFLRGILREIVARGHEAIAYEPADGWSRRNQAAEAGGADAMASFGDRFPGLVARTYDGAPDLDRALDGADVVVVHEWTEPGLIDAIGRHRATSGSYALLLHDTHHRAVSAESEIAALKLDGYDAVLAFGEVLCEIYRARGWGRRVFCWHEAADIRQFRPLAAEKSGDLVWIGNWGDGERSAELETFLIGPAERLRLAAGIYGVRYPAEAIGRLARAGLNYRGWLPNAAVPDVFARHRVTVHVPRRPYRERLLGIPTIRVFEALACGIPLICAPWRDTESLFRPGRDYLTAASGPEMGSQLRRVLNEPALARSLARSGLETIAARHTCAHRVDELFSILARLDAVRPRARAMEEAV
jgi:spore maturation protein CgeB